MMVRRGDSYFEGKRVLLVESEQLVPFTFYRALQSLGAEVVGPVAFRDDVALLMGDSHIDGAILDSRMRPEEHSAVQTLLRGLDVPFVDACGCLRCLRGKGGCFSLSDAEDDLHALGRALSGATLSGARSHKKSFASSKGYRMIRPALNVPRSSKQMMAADAIG